MPTSHNNLWEQIITFENLYHGFEAAARGRRYTSSVLGYRMRLEENIIDTINRLTWQQWQPAPFRQFFVHDPKKRLISAPPFKDRVLHHALVRIIAPLFERKFVADSFACQVRKGTHAAKLRVEQFVNASHRQWGSYYVLKGDIRAYFHSIDRAVLLDIIARTISDKTVLWLLWRIVRFDDCAQGIPIGTLTSQLLANVYLDALDHYVKDELGVKMYARYMDDFVVIHQDKTFLRGLLEEIDAFITDRLHLTLNPKTEIFKSGAGTCHAVDFCGYRIWPGYTKPRKRTVKAARKRFRKLSTLYSRGKVSLERIRASITSFTGYMKHCNGNTSLNSILNGAVFTKGGVKLITLRFDDGLSIFQKMISETGKQAPFITMTSLNDLAFMTRDKEIETMQKVFKTPKPQTMKNIKVRMATKSNLTAVIAFNQLWDWDEYMAVETDGGPRPMKRGEKKAFGRYYVPGVGAQLDQYGNINGGQIQQIISYLQRFGETGYKMNRTASRNVALGRGMTQYFMLTKPINGLPAGVFMRVDKGQGQMLYARALASKPRDIDGKRIRKADIRSKYRAMLERGVLPVLVFVNKAPRYKALFPFYAVGRQVMAEKTSQVVQKRTEEAMRNAR